MKHFIVKVFRQLELTDSFFFKLCQRLNDFIFHRNSKEQKKCFGKMNPDKTFYVIRCMGKEAGLLCLYFDVLKKIIYAIDKNFIPIIDYKNYPSQYNDRKKINSWDLFFNQPSDFSLKEVYSSKNVILASCSPLCDYNELIRNISNNAIHSEKEIFLINTLCKKYIYPKKEILDIVEKETLDYFNGEVVLGIFLRGTDYTRFKPKGHFIQPNLNTVKKDIHKYIAKYPISKIFIVTEDDNIFNSLNSEFQNLVIKYNDIRFAKYDGKDFLANYKREDSYTIGFVYLKKLLLLAKCQYIIASATNGSKFSFIINNNQFKDKIIYDLGKY